MTALKLYFLICMLLTMQIWTQWTSFPSCDLFISKLNERCMKFVPNETYFSFDESMVPYFGHHGCKQFIRGKPIWFGYKFWCGATRLGYISCFQLYQGKNPNTKHEKCSVSESLVLQFSEALTRAHPGQCYFVFDNSFTSIALLG